MTTSSTNPTTQISDLDGRRATLETKGGRVPIAVRDQELASALSNIQYTLEEIKVLLTAALGG